MFFAQGAAEHAAAQDAPLPGLPLADPAHVNPIAGLVLLALALAAAPLVLLLVRKITGPTTSVRATWGLPEAAAVAAVFVLLQLAMFLIASLFAHAPGAAAPAEDGAKFDITSALLGSAALFVVTAAFALRLVRATTADAAAALGLARPHVARTLGAALVCFFLAFAVQGGLGPLWASALRAVGVTETEQPIARLMFDVPREQRALVVVLGVAIVPFLEEFLFRGFLQPALARYVPVAAAIVLTSVVFGALHGLEAFVPIVGLSCVLGIARERTASVWVPWVMHALNNGAAFALLWHSSASPGA